MIISKKAFKEAIEREKTKAFCEGYERGKRAGYWETIERKLTPNMLREFLGLPKIEREASNDADNTD